ncbi:MAG: hypothetical protein HRT35_30425 [Algicola sp.]|nr:hypothetical protein [Algicola sp.]
MFEADDHAQIISRTWSPKQGPHNFALILNDFLYDSPWTQASSAIKTALNIPLPRTWHHVNKEMPNGQKLALSQNRQNIGCRSYSQEQGRKTLIYNPRSAAVIGGVFQGNWQKMIFSFAARVRHKVSLVISSFSCIFLLGGYTSDWSQINDQQ